MLSVHSCKEDKCNFSMDLCNSCCCCFSALDTISSENWYLSSMWNFNYLGVEWQDGSALYYILSIDQYTSALGHYLLGFPTLLRICTKLWVWLEILIPFLLCIPLLTGPIRFSQKSCGLMTSQILRSVCNRNHGLGWLANNEHWFGSCCPPCWCCCIIAKMVLGLCNLRSESQILFVLLTSVSQIKVCMCVFCDC